MQRFGQTASFIAEFESSCLTAAPGNSDNNHHEDRQPYRQRRPVLQDKGKADQSSKSFISGTWKLHPPPHPVHWSKALSKLTCNWCLTNSTTQLSETKTAGQGNSCITPHSLPPQHPSLAEQGDIPFRLTCYALPKLTLSNTSIYLTSSLLEAKSKLNKDI